MFDNKALTAFAFKAYHWPIGIESRLLNIAEDASVDVLVLTDETLDAPVNCTD